MKLILLWQSAGILAPVKLLHERQDRNIINAE